MHAHIEGGGRSNKRVAEAGVSVNEPRAQPPLHAGWAPPAAHDRLGLFFAFITKFVPGIRISNARPTKWKMVALFLLDCKCANVM
jgi:hypothetical protein